MAKSKLNLENSAYAWDEKRRYKVNEIVTHLGRKYQNLTGKNSEPGVGTDWYYDDLLLKLEPISYVAVSTGANQTFTVPYEPGSVLKSKGELYKGTEWIYSGTTLTILVSISTGNTIYIKP